MKVDAMAEEHLESGPPIAGHERFREWVLTDRLRRIKEKRAQRFYAGQREAVESSGS